jgi:hypothetical protein
MRRITLISPLIVVAALALGCAADGADAETAGEPPATAGENARGGVPAQLEELRERVDDLERRTEALEAASEGPPDGVTDPEPAPGSDEPARLRTPEGLIDQLRVYLRDLEGMPEEWEPGVTDWSPFEIPDEVQGVYDTPGEIVAELAAVTDAPQLGTEVWETTIRVLLDEDDPDLAYGAVLSWGFLDDSIEGRDVRITLTRTDDDRWEPGGAEERFQCMRGVTDDGELCI